MYLKSEHIGLGILNLEAVALQKSLDNIMKQDMESYYAIIIIAFVVKYSGIEWTEDVNYWASPRSCSWIYFNRVGVNENY